MIYAAFSLWLFLILFAGIGVYRLWARLARPAWVSWALLPGTVVSEMAYIFGCLITGGEIRRAKLMPNAGAAKGRSGQGDAEPATEASQRLRFVGPVVAALLSVAACAAAIVVVHALLGDPVIDEFAGPNRRLSAASLPKELPGGWNAAWGQVEGQIRLLKRMCETLVDIHWLDWRVPLFVYLAACLSVRLAPVRRDPRATLAAVVVIASVIGLIGAVSDRFGGLMADIWPLLTYVWTNLLLLLVLSLLISGGVGFIRILAGRHS